MFRQPLFDFLRPHPGLLLPGARCRSCDAFSWLVAVDAFGHDAQMIHWVTGWMAVGIASAGAAAPDFATEVAPILEANCLSCHDTAHHKGDFILETRAAALSHKSAIVPGDPGASELLESISGPEPEMPKKGKPLSATEVDVLRRWIAAGAQWPEERVLVENRPRDLDWWSLRPIPYLRDAGAVDEFIAPKLNEAKLEPTPYADPVTLIRRLTYDLTGLPPTPEEVAAFVRDAQEDLYKAVSSHVDRLLASPAFGEAWARHWLDVARYAETHGYDKDKPRLNAWPYRDYVIRSLNRTSPSPVRPGADRRGCLVSREPRTELSPLAFSRRVRGISSATWKWGRAKLDGRIAKHLDRDEMVSSRLQRLSKHHGAMCPVSPSQVRSRQDGGLLPASRRVCRRRSGGSRLLRLGARGGKGAQRFAGENQWAQGGAIQTPDRSQTSLGRSHFGNRTTLDDLRTKYGSPLRPQYGYHSAISPSQAAEKWVQVDLGMNQGVEQVRLIPAYDQFNGIGAGFGFPVRYRVEVSNDPEFKAERRLVRDATGADQPNPRNGEVAIDVGGAGLRYIRVTATKLAPRQNDFIFALGEVRAIGGENHDNRASGAQVTALDSIEAPPRWSRTNLTDGIFYREVADPAALAEFQTLEAQKAAIEAELRDPARDARLAELEKALAELAPKLAALPQGQLVYAASTRFPAQGAFRATEGKVREIHLLKRGDIKNPGDLMTPGAPPLWPGAPAEFAAGDEGQARAALASYLTAHDNPLVWRSMVNRLWQWTFGEGLVATPNDFGRMGLPPTSSRIARCLGGAVAGRSESVFEIASSATWSPAGLIAVPVKTMWPMRGSMPITHCSGGPTGAGSPRKNIAILCSPSAVFCLPPIRAGRASKISSSKSRSTLRTTNTDYITWRIAATLSAQHLSLHRPLPAAAVSHRARLRGSVSERGSAG